MYLWNHKKWTSFCILIHIFYFKDNVSHARVLFFAYAAQFLRLCPEVICPIIALSNRAEHLLIYRIQSHTYPKRRKFSLKQAGQKSVKEDLPEQRKAPKRAVECQLKVQTHIWDQDAGSSSLPLGPKALWSENFRGLLLLFAVVQLLICFRRIWVSIYSIQNKKRSHISAIRSRICVTPFGTRWYNFQYTLEIVRLAARPHRSKVLFR